MDAKTTVLYLSINNQLKNMSLQIVMTYVFHLVIDAKIE